MAKTIEHVPLVSNEDIARCAYEIWEREGRPEGRAATHWFEAETILQARSEATRPGGRKASRSNGARGATPRAEKHFEPIS